MVGSGMSMWHNCYRLDIRREMLEVSTNIILFKMEAKNKNKSGVSLYLDMNKKTCSPDHSQLK